MGVASLSAKRSKDPSTQVGACVVNQDKRIIGIGYNGLPYGCNDDEYPWDREGDFLETKYPFSKRAFIRLIIYPDQNQYSFMVQHHRSTLYKGYVAKREKDYLKI